MITLDVVMPGCDGWEVLHRLKADPQLSEVPVIMVTIVDNEAMALKLGATNYLVKPVDRERLAALIKKYISTESAPSSANRPASASARRKQAAANRS
jgi:CheY-like chemotaxis protein